MVKTHPLNEDVKPEENTDDPLRFFVYTDRDGNQVTLDLAMHDWLVDHLRKTVKRLEETKDPVKRRWQAVEKAIRDVISTVQTERYYGLVPYGKQSVQTLLSHFWSRSLQTPKIFFSMEGEDQQSKDLAPELYAALMRHCQKDRQPQKLDKALLLHALPKGVCLSHVGYKKCVHPMRGPDALLSKWEPPKGDTDDAQPSQDIRTGERKVYEGGTVTIIDPEDFVFDTENHENWDACFKAYTRKMVYEDLEDDDNFSNYEDLYELIQEAAQKVNDTFAKRNKKNNQTVGTGIDAKGNLDVVEIHGDIRLKDGTYLRNWTITMAANKKIVRFEENPYFINPFTKWCYEETDDGWGVSPIEYILPLIDAGSALLSTGVEGAKIAINPPLLAPEEYFQQKRHVLTQGMIISYKPKTTTPNIQPIPIQINYQAPFPYVQLFEAQSEATTGATRQLSGNVTTNDKVQTATEFQGLSVVGNLIIDRTVDLFNLDFKIVNIEKVAMINAFFNPEELPVSVDNEKGIKEFKTVKPEAYFGNYRYYVEDNKSEMERKQNLQEKAGLFQSAINDPDIGKRLKKIDIFKDMLRDFGYGTPGTYFMDDLEYMTTQMKDLAIEQNIQVMAQQMAQSLLMREGVMPNAGPQAGQESGPPPGGPGDLPQGPAGNPIPPGDPGMGAV